MLDPQQRIWGFETNFGGLAELALVKSNQLMPKPAHLTWEEAAAPGLVNSTAYRQLVSHNGADMKQGDVVLIWGASGGLGSYATQFALNGGAIPVCVVSSPEKAEHRAGRWAPSWSSTAPPRATGSGRTSDTQDPKEWQRLGQEDPRADRRRRPRHRLRAPRPGDLRRLGLRRQARRHHRDLRLHQRLPARLRQPLPVDEPQADHRLATSPTTARPGRPTGYRPRPDPPHPVRGLPAGRGRPGRLDVHQNAHQGKVGVLCLAPEEGLGVRDPAARST